MQDEWAIWRREWKSILVVFAASVIPFLPALFNGFVNWDDPRFILDNPHIRGLTGSNIAAMFTTFVDGNYIPFTLLSFAVNHELHGLQPAGFHVANILLHGINAVLVLLLLRRMGGSAISAAFGALLFSLHPLRVESVVWATERKDVLFALFYFMALLAYLQYLENRSIKQLAAVWVLFLCSGLAKQMAISLPIVLLLLDFAARRKWEWRVLLEKIPFVAGSLGFVAVAYVGQHASDSILHGTQYTPLHRLLLSCNSLVMYLKSLVWPMDLSCIYPYPKDVVSEAAYTPFVILLLAGIVFFLGRKFRPLWIAGLLFLVTLAPVLNVVPAGAQMVADRFMYLPSVAFSYLVAVTTAGGWTRWSRLRRQLALVAATALLALMPVLTWQRSAVWKNDLTLWNDTVRKAPDAFVAHSNLALAQMNAGDFEAAVRGFTRAIALSPTVSDSYSNRGLSYRKLGKREAALADFTMAVTLEPDNATYWFNRAETYYDNDECDKALSDYARALELDPKRSDALMGQGICLGMQGKFEDAAESFSKVLAQDPEDSDARFNRGKAYFEAGRLNPALEDFNEILLRDPTYAKALYHRAVVLLELNRMEEAWRDIRAVQQLGFQLPDDVLQRIPEDIRRRP